MFIGQISKATTEHKDKTVKPNVDLLHPDKTDAKSIPQHHNRKYDNDH